MGLLLGQLHTRAAKAWRKFDQYLEIICAFAINSAEEIEEDKDLGKSTKYDAESEAYKVGVEVFFKQGLLTILGDFVLQEDSPMYKDTDMRPRMGQTSSLYSSFNT